MNLINSANKSGAVTKSDSTVLNFKRLYIGGTGDVAIQHSDALDSVVTYRAVPAGFYLDVAGCRVMSTNTTATNIVWMNW